jgi:hypothetical protein
VKGDATSNLFLRSTVDGSYWYLSVKGTAGQSVDYVDVKDSNANVGYSNLVSATHSINSGHNTNWVFADASVTNTWIGVVHSVWSHGGNWDLLRAPDEADTAIIISNGCAY